VDVLPASITDDLLTVKHLLLLKDADITSEEARAVLDSIVTKSSDESYTGIYKVLVGVTCWEALRGWINE
jgi:hypothetical protein